MIRVFLSGIVAMAVHTQTVAQKIDDERMTRDIEVAENVLGTLIRQQFNNQRTFFPLEVKGSYQAGYGVTFSLPADFTTPIAFSVSGGNNDVIIWGNEPSIGVNSGTGVRTYSSWDTDEEEAADEARENRTGADADKSYRLKDRKEKEREKNRMSLDSVKLAYNLKVIEAAKIFLVDYGDMITQLGAQEKIVITNQGNNPRKWVGQYFSAPKRTHLSIEVSKADITAFRQGKITRDQALAKVKVVNTETVDEVEPDLELLSSIFNRLYRLDLSKTYFIEDNIYYEHLKDFGVIYYMQVYGSVPIDYKRFTMPTINLADIDLETRNKKVADLYPKFEQDLKDNVLEYGRTLKNLKENEVLVFQVAMTKCSQCGIPSSLELTVKASVLKDLASGKMEKNAALSKISVKKGSNQ
ncbi:MAG TPA: hypothetical protein VGK59_00740 [Ohtaekwangia sp.]